MRRYSILAITGLTALNLSNAKSQELVTNGSFQGCTGLTCSGWALQTDLPVGANNFSGGFFRNGYDLRVPAAQLGGATLSQQIQTSKNGIYRTSYTVNLRIVGTPYLFQSSFGGVTLQSLSSTGLSTTPTRYTFISKAASDLSSLIFFGYNNPDKWLLSDVSVILLTNSTTVQPYADIQSIGLDALKNQRELVLNQAGECDQRGWVVYDSDKVKGSAKPKKHQSLCVFAEGGYATGSINGSSTVGSYSTSNASSAYGIEWKPSRQWAVGAAYGYGTANLGGFNFQDTSAYINSNINSANIYGAYRPNKNWKVVALAGYSNFNYTGSRTFLGDSANSNFSANGYTAALQGSYDIILSTDYNNKKNPLNPVRLKPLLGIAWGGNQQAGFSETGSGSLLNVQGQTTNSLLGTVGATFEAPIPLNQSKTTVLTPRIGIAYQYDFLANQDGNKSITAALTDDPTTQFTEIGQNRGASSVYLNLGSDLQINRNTTLYASVNYQAFTNGNQFGYQGGARVKF